jgi:hypothetical protein
MTNQKVSSKNIIIAVVIIALIGLYYLFSSGPKMSAPAEEQFAAIQAGDLAKAYSYMSTAFQQQTNQETFNTFLGGYPTLIIKCKLITNL